MPTAATGASANDDVQAEKASFLSSIYTYIFMALAFAVCVICAFIALFCVRSKRNKQKHAQVHTNMVASHEHVASDDDLTRGEIEMPAVTVSEKERGFYVRARAEYAAADEDQLDLQCDAVLFVLEAMQSGWWYALDEQGRDGWIPSNFVRRCGADEQRALQAQQKLHTNVDELRVNQGKYAEIVLPPEVEQRAVATGGDLLDDASSSESALFANQQTSGQSPTANSMAATKSNDVHVDLDASSDDDEDDVALYQAGQQQTNA